MKWMLDTDTCTAIIKRSSGSALKKIARQVHWPGRFICNYPGRAFLCSGEEPPPRRGFRSTFAVHLSPGGCCFRCRHCLTLWRRSRRAREAPDPNRTARYIDRCPRPGTGSHSGHAQHTRALKDRGPPIRGLGRLETPLIPLEPMSAHRMRRIRLLRCSALPEMGLSPPGIRAVHPQ